MYADTLDIPLSENVNIKARTRKMEKSSDHPLGIEFAVMGFVKLLEVIRIDNSPHQGKPGTHIHFLDKDKRKGKEVVEESPQIKNPEQAIDYVDLYLRSRYPML